MIDIFNDDGSVGEYLTVAERFPGFLAQYGPGQGYRVRAAVKDFLGIHPELKAVYQAAIAAGYKPADIGLPSIDPTLFRFEASLLDGEGNVIAEASALRRINTNIDAALEARLWEGGETAALQRLMARTGHASDTLLADEMADISERGVDFKPHGEKSAETAPDGEASPEESDRAKKSTGARKPRASQASANEAPATKATPAPSEKAPDAAQPAPAKATQGEVSEALLRQIRSLAHVRGIEPPEVHTKAQAKEALKRLRETPAATTTT